MTPAVLQAWMTRHAWSRYRLARTLGRHETTIANWLDGSTQALPPELPLALCELERRICEKAGLGFCSCPACGAIAVEDAGLDDRYGCILCGARVEP